jgi:hypothetical protein
VTELLVPQPNPELEVHPLSAVREFLFFIFPAILPIWMTSPLIAKWGLTHHINKKPMWNAQCTSVFMKLVTYEVVSKSRRIDTITKYTLTFGNTCWKATQRFMAAKLTGLTHKIAIQLHLVAESCTSCSSRSRQLVRKILNTTSYFKIISFSNFFKHSVTLCLPCYEWSISYWSISLFVPCMHIFGLWIYQWKLIMPNFVQFKINIRSYCELSF